MLFNEKNDLGKVTVSELVKRADINRGTFYLHFDDIYSVAEEIQEEIQEALFDSLKADSTEELESYFKTVFEHLRENENNYKMLLKSEGPKNFLDRLKKKVSDKLYQAFSKHNKVLFNRKIKLDILVFTDGLVEQYIKYVRGTIDYSLDELQDYSIDWLNNIKRRCEL